MTRFYGGQSMVAPLRRVLLCPPAAAGWDAPARAGRWRELGYLRDPDAARANRDFETLRRLLVAARIEVVALRPDAALSMDAVYAHDPSLMTDHGAICLRMGKPAREAEPSPHRRAYREIGVPILGVIEAPGTAESGDVIWLDPGTLLVGRGYRTNAEGIRQLQQILGPYGVNVVSAPLPHGQGPDVCLHLMSLMSLLDEKTALVDFPFLAVETVELLRERGYRFVEMHPEERGTLGCNVLSLGNRRLVALAENIRTNRRLGEAGFEVVTFEGSEIAINGGGGPTCLTRPILRAMSGEK
jgi:dimethylargininase